MDAFNSNPIIFWCLIVVWHFVVAYLYPKLVACIYVYGLKAVSVTWALRSRPCSFL